MLTRTAVYLDQLDNDPIKACEFAAELGIKDVCLRRVWSTHIGAVASGIHERLMRALSANGLRTALMDSDLGGNISQISEELVKVEDLCKICQAYECQRLVIRWGKRARSDNTKRVMLWMDAVSHKTLDWAIQPLYPIAVDGAITDPAAMAWLRQRSTRWRFIYDPAGLVSGISDHVTKYWSLLNESVWGLDVCDSMPGTGPCVVGDGRGRLDVLLSAWARNPKQCLLLKPNIRQNTIIRPRFTEYLAQLRSLTERIGVNLDIKWPQGD
jgi:hypothetical protein